MKTITAILVAAAASAALASCPSMCSGHGACTTDDQCRCWKGFEGYDCSQRACPVVEAWAVDDPENPHSYAECAGKGICDKTTGTCQCFDGYEGRGCERSACPNSCSGHGKCRMLADLDSYSGAKLAAPGSWNAYSWDEKAILSCECDGGYTGPDCSQRICPHGDDPMTVCESGNTEQVQKVTFSFYGDHSDPAFANAKLQNTDYALQFKSYAGETFYTATVRKLFGDNTDDTASSTLWGAPITGTNAEGDLEDALKGIPNFRIRDVTVSSGFVAGTDLTVSYYVTFHHETAEGNNFGQQNLLMCPHSREVGTDMTTYGCGAAGCRPKIQQPRIVSAMGAAGTGSNFADAASTISFSKNSVLTCPVGATCSGATSTQYQGSVSIVTAEDGSDFRVWAKGAGVTTAKLVADTAAAASDDMAGALDVVGSTYTFLGMLKDFPVVSTDRYAVDISSVMADTTVEINSAGLSGVIVNEFELAFITVQCEETTDVTIDGADGFNNIDVENIECSGRGVCDRATGTCGCFEGYTGLACGEQTILI